MEEDFGLCGAGSFDEVAVDEGENVVAIQVEFLFDLLLVAPDEGEILGRSGLGLSLNFSKSSTFPSSLFSMLESTLQAVLRPPMLFL